MKIKKFNIFLKENILDEEGDETGENKWEVRINDKTDSFWEYKHDAIEQILEILDTQGNNGLEGYEDEDEYQLSKSEIADILFDMNQDDFYDKLEELKDFAGYDNYIDLINIGDEDELEFLE